MDTNETIAIPDGKEDFDLYNCHSCGRLITREQELAAYKTGIVCECGSTRYRPVKTVNAEPNLNGDYVVTGRYGEKVTLPKAEFEATYKQPEVV